MNKRKIHLLFSLIIFICLCFSLPSSVYASELPDNSTKNLTSTELPEYSTNDENSVESWDQYVTDQISEDGTFSDEDISLDTESGNDPTILSMGGSNSLENEETFRSIQAVPSDISRYTVLVLDVSGSMYGTPITNVKLAANKFCEAVLQANGENYVALVTFSDNASIICDFTNDLDTLQNAINDLSAWGSTNTNQSLEYAGDLLDSVADSDSTVKNIVILSDGLPEAGTAEYTGQYTSSDYWGYYYANSAYDTAQTLKDKCSIYSLGFFHSLYGSNLIFGQRFMNDLQNAGYYEVTNVNDLQFTFGDIAGDITDNAGQFTYADADGNYTSDYYYSDNYFSYDANEYHRDLATMSLCLAFSAFGKSGGEWEDKSDNVKDLLSQIGFNDSEIEANDWFKVQPTTDSIGFVVANKQIQADDGDYTLITVAIRGGNYKREWAGNFKLGTSGEHQGFSEAKEQVLTYLKDYIINHGISGNIKLWITGYSRAAATTNLVAGALDNGESLGDSVALDPSDLYAYCFEPPQGALLEDMGCLATYHNIFNIINKSDPVPQVAPSALGFYRYGYSYFLPSAESYSNYKSLRRSMLEKYYALDNTTTYTVDDFSMKKIDWSVFPELKIYLADDTENQKSQGVFLDQVISTLVKENIKTRSNYVNKYQDHLRQVFRIVNSEEEQWQDFVRILQNKLSSNAGTLIVSTTPAGEFFVGNTTDLIEEYAVESLNEAGISTYDEKEIHRLAASLGALVVDFAVSHPNLTATLACNFQGIKSAHYPELCLAWMQSMDRNYTTGAQTAFNNGAYRIIRINCPVDVEVFDNSDSLVAAITSNHPQGISESSIISAVNEDGEKIVYIPADADYNVRFTATDNGTMTYSINEFCPAAGDMTRVINYYNIDIKDGDILTGSLPAYNDDDLENSTLDGSSAAYTLLGADNELIDADTDLTGTEATEAYYMVNVEADREDYGIVTGQGIRQLGQFAKVTAKANEGYEFIGWYIGRRLVSTDSEYRFCVMEDVTLTAEFMPPGHPGSHGNHNTSSGTPVTNPDEEPSAYGTPSDITGHWAKDSIMKLIDAGAATGYPDGTFQPDKTITRAEFIVMVVKALKLEAKTNINFADSASHWANDSIATAVAYGLIGGYDAYHFGPDDLITREQAALIIANAAKLAAVTDELEFIDSSAVSSWAKPGIAAAVQGGYISGYPDNSFKPQGNTTRAEAAVMIAKLL